MAEEVEYGKPLFTTGVLGAASAQDDLGIEGVGAGLLRRLVPGIIQNTPNAGYYSFYPYLLWKWEQLGGSNDRREFIPFYRRHESAFSVACEMHSHRDDAPLYGINGANAAAQVVRQFESGDANQLDLEEHAGRYMDTPLGGYSLFYAATLQDARLVKLGAPGFVDKVTDAGRVVAESFASFFEETEYATTYFSGASPVPPGVLAELGDAACLCTVPGRGDHDELQKVIFGDPLPSGEWEERRRGRVESLCLLLEFHAQRPAGAGDGLFAWRRALLDPRFSSGEQWVTSFEERRNNWRAYQLREVSVLALTTIWSLFINELARLSRATQLELNRELLSWVTAERLQMDPAVPLSSAAALAAELVPTGEALAREAEPLQSEWKDERQRALCRAIRVLLVVRREIDRSGLGFDELLDEGGNPRWSLEYLRNWLDARSEITVVVAVNDLLEALYHQHIRVALSKVRTPSAKNIKRFAGGWRDPFNFAEDEGMLRPLRAEEPFWTFARYDVLNHFLWTLGLLSSPRQPTELTPLGRETLNRHSNDA